MQNYHSHKSFSNCYTPFKDSAMGYEDYAKRAVELGQDVITCVDHGTQGNWLRCLQTAQKYNLKFIYGVEAYWVMDRHEPDKTNAHIILLAQTNKGVEDLNELISIANEDGFYHVPRIDIDLLLTLDPKDVYITTACVAFWGRPDRTTQRLVYHDYDYESLIDRLVKHFGDSMAFEVQCHHTEWQKTVNKTCLEYSRKYSIPIIAGLDSHYIYPSQREERRWLREESGIHMDDDFEFGDDVYEDYPDEETVIQRFREQGVLTEQEIRDAIDMTDTLLFFEDIERSTERKLPTIYPQLTQEERDKKYLDMVWSAWKRDKAKYLKSGHPESEYVQAINEETDIVTSTGVSDYFILDSEMIHLGQEMGGVVTPTGRGSASSFFTNTLLGLSTIDRISLPVPLYPQRFVTADRLKTSLPDIDMNIDRQEPFVQAQEKLLGKGHIYPMLAYGTLKYKSAFKLYARAQGLPADIANDVSKQINKYEIAIKEAEDEEAKELIDIADYVEEQYIPYIDASAPYRGIVVRKSQAPCAFMIYQGDIRREIGIIRVNADGGKKTVYCTVCDGYTAEDFGYVKNDVLIVSVLSINAECMRRAGLPQYTSQDIIELTAKDKATWDLLAKGYTQGINQCQGEGTTDKLMQYKPRSLKDMAAFVAAIRPGFKSKVKQFLGRERFEYGIPSFDAILKNDSSGSSWLLYQEDVMHCLSLAGFPMDETYPIIKAISKKKVSVINAAKERFLEGFAKHIMDTDGKQSEDAKAIADDVWQVIIDSSSYSFNASHAACVALDALYGAYLKAHYPYEYYTVLLDSYASKGDKKKTGLIKAEMKKAFGIKMTAARFRQDNRTFFIDREHHCISDALTSVKYISKSVADSLYERRENEYGSFVDLLIDLVNDKVFTKRTIDILIHMDYFSEFGHRGKLLSIYNEFFDGKHCFKKTYVDKTKETRIDWLRTFEQEVEDNDIDIVDQMVFECEHYGTPLTISPKDKLFVALEVDTSYTPKIKFYSVATGVTSIAKIKKDIYRREPIEVGNIIRVQQSQQRPAYMYVNGKAKAIEGRKEHWILSYTISNKQEVSA